MFWLMVSNHKPFGPTCAARIQFIYAFSSTSSGNAPSSFVVPLNQQVP